MSKKEYAKLNTNNDDDESVPLKKAQGDDSSSSDEHIDAVANISKVGFGTAFKNIIINSLVVSSVYIINTITRNVSFHFVRPEGTLITSAFGVGNTFLTIFCVAIIVSLNVGMLINSSKQYGQNDFRGIGSSLHKALIINLFALVPVTMLIFFSRSVLIAMRIEVELANEISAFLVESLPGLWMYVGFSSLNFYLNAMKVFKPQAFIQVINSALYCVLAYIFIEKHHLGLKGAALSFNIMNGSSLIMILLYIKAYNPVPQSFFWFTKESITGVWNQFKEELQIGITLLAGWIGEEVFSLVSGTLGNDESAAFLITMTTILIFQTFRIGSNDTSASYISTCVSQGSYKGVMTYFKANFSYVMIYSIAGLLLMEVVPSQIASIYIQDPKVIERAAFISRIMGPTMISDGLGQLFAVVFRTVGFQGQLAVIAAISAFVIGIPVGVLTATKLGLGSVGLGLGYIVTSWSNLIGMLVYYYFYMDLKKKVEESTKQKVGYDFEEDSQLIDGDFNSELTKEQAKQNKKATDNL